jgi:hypothetical protein
MEIMVVQSAGRGFPISQYARESVGNGRCWLVAVILQGRSSQLDNARAGDCVRSGNTHHRVKRAMRRTRLYRPAAAAGSCSVRPSSVRVSLLTCGPMPPSRFGSSASEPRL